MYVRKYHPVKQVGALTLRTRFDILQSYRNMVANQEDLQARINEHVKISLLCALADIQEEVSDEPPHLIQQPCTETANNATANNAVAHNTTEMLLKMIETLSQKNQSTNFQFTIKKH